MFACVGASLQNAALLASSSRTQLFSSWVTNRLLP